MQYSPLPPGVSINEPSWLLTEICLISVYIKLIAGKLGMRQHGSWVYHLNDSEQLSGDLPSGEENMR
jgi:hypothetical protein